jgi:RimJ/RimL family protein N-acetyltransferase
MTGDQSPTNTESIILKSPAACSKEELSCFLAMVAGAGEVNKEGLQNRIGGAEALAFLKRGEEIIGVGALKRPNLTYKARVFKKANAKSLAGEFGLELGWLVIGKAHRGNKHSQIIVQALLAHSKNKKLYATSASTNEPMHKTLIKYKFQQEGVAWPSDDRETSLLLFVN